MIGWQLQGLRFVSVGLTSNVILYLMYLLVTMVGIGHKTAMTFLFTLGTLQTFLFNKRWTFAHRGFVKTSLIKYVSAYGFAYLLNLSALVVFVDVLALPHEFVQAVMIFVLAVMLFILQKFWVFPTPLRTRPET